MLESDERRSKRINNWGRHGMTRRSIRVGVALATTTSASLSALPSASADGGARAEVAEPAPDEAHLFDLSTPERARDFMEKLGISAERVERFANGLGTDSQGYYEAVARAFQAETAATGETAPAVDVVDGVIRYNNTVVNSSMKFTRTQTRTQIGTPVADRCLFPDLAVDGNIGDYVVSEVVSLDPKSCVRTVFDGAYDPRSLAAEAVRTNGLGAPLQTTAAAGGPQLPVCGSVTSPPTLYQPPEDPVSGQYLRYYKHSFVDPVCITITSSTLNVRWKNAVGSSTKVTVLPGTKANLMYFTALGENWVNKVWWQSPQTAQTVTATNEVLTELYHERKETDFPEHLILAAGLVGFAGMAIVMGACAFDLSDTYFQSDQKLRVRRNAAWQASGFGNVSGGCSSLVHEKTWHGSGAFAK